MRPWVLPVHSPSMSRSFIISTQGPRRNGCSPSSWSACSSAITLGALPVNLFRHKKIAKPSTVAHRNQVYKRTKMATRYPILAKLYRDNFKIFLPLTILYWYSTTDFGPGGGAGGGGRGWSNPHAVHTLTGSLRVWKNCGNTTDAQKLWRKWALIFSNMENSKGLSSIANITCNTLKCK